LLPDGRVRKSDVDAAATRLPAGSWDTHVHVFDSSIGPFAPTRAYTPAQATVNQLLEFSASLHLGNQSHNIVVVQPSPYRTDNTILLEVLKQLHTQRNTIVRGIVVVDIEIVTDTELLEMHNIGVRGIRLNLQADGDKISLESVRNMMKATADRIKTLPGWKLQVFFPGSIWDGGYLIT
jgi:predicted TIM-barrel fold metal-dependent hydrolase